MGSKKHPLGWEDPLEKGQAPHSSILAWRIPWTTVHGVSKSWTRLSDFHFLWELVFELREERPQQTDPGAQGPQGFS